MRLLGSQQPEQTDLSRPARAQTDTNKEEWILKYVNLGFICTKDAIDFIFWMWSKFNLVAKKKTNKNPKSIKGLGKHLYCVMRIKSPSVFLRVFQQITHLLTEVGDLKNKFPRTIETIEKATCNIIRCFLIKADGL